MRFPDRFLAMLNRFGGVSPHYDADLVWGLIALLVAVVLIPFAPVAALIMGTIAGVVLSRSILRRFERRQIGPPAPLDKQFLLWHWGIVGIIGLNYAWFFIKDGLSLPGLVLMCSALLLRWIFTRSWYRRTPLDAPIIIIWSIALLSGLVLSSIPTLTYPKLSGLTLSIVLFYEIVLGLRQPANLVPWLIATCLLGLGIVMVGLAGTADLLLSVPLLREIMPEALFLSPRAFTGSFHPNGIAGVLSFVIIAYGALLWRDWSRNVRLGLLAYLLAVAAFGGSLGLLILTGSRGAVLGVLSVALALFWAHRRRPGLSLLSLSIMLSGFFSVLISVAVFPLFRSLGIHTHPLIDLLSVVARLRYWHLGLAVFQGNAWHGIGLGAFDHVARNEYANLYPSWIAKDGGWLPHVHNELLQMAIDLGIFGFVGYILLLSLAAQMVWRGYMQASVPMERRLLIGLGAGLVAHLSFGLTDVVYLGSKPGVLMWLLLGLITGLYLIIRQTSLELITDACKREPC